MTKSARRRRRARLGHPPQVHVRLSRTFLRFGDSSYREMQRALRAGNCPRALGLLLSTYRRAGEVDAHVESAGVELEQSAHARHVQATAHRARDIFLHICGVGPK